MSFIGPPKRGLSGESGESKHGPYNSLQQEVGESQPSPKLKREYTDATWEDVLAITTAFAGGFDLSTTKQRNLYHRQWKKMATYLKDVHTEIFDKLVEMNPESWIRKCFVAFITIIAAVAKPATLDTLKQLYQKTLNSTQKRAFDKKIANFITELLPKEEPTFITLHGLNKSFPDITTLYTHKVGEWCAYFTNGAGVPARVWTKIPTREEFEKSGYGTEDHRTFQRLSQKAATQSTSLKSPILYYWWPTEVRIIFNIDYEKGTREVFYASHEDKQLKNVWQPLCQHLGASHVVILDKNGAQHSSSNPNDGETMLSAVKQPWKVSREQLMDLMQAAMETSHEVPPIDPTPLARVFQDEGTSENFSLENFDVLENFTLEDFGLDDFSDDIVP